MLALNKDSGLWDTRAPGRRIGRAFLGRLVSRPNPLMVPGRRIDRAFLDQLVPRPGPKVPTMPLFFLPGRKTVPGQKKEQV